MDTYYISGTGDDATGDGSYANPWRNLAYALPRVGVSDTIVNKIGINIQTLDVPSPQMEGITITGETTDYRDSILDFDGNIFRFKNTGGSGIGLFPKIENITIRNANYNSSVSAITAIFGSMNSGLILNNCLFDYIGLGGDTSGSRQWGSIVARLNLKATVTNCIFRDIFFWNGSDCGYFGGRQIFNYEGDQEFRGNTFITSTKAIPVGTLRVNNCFGGLAYGSTTTIKNNTFYFEDPVTFTLGDVYDTAIASNNNYFNTTYAGSEVGTTTSDPLLVDPDNGFFQPGVGSVLFGGGEIS